MFARQIFSVLIVLSLAGTSPILQAQQAQDQDRPQVSPPPQSSKDKPRSRKSLFPDDVEGLEEMAWEARQEGNGLRFLQTQIKLREKQPLNPDHIAGMSIAYAMMGRQTTSFDYMWRLQKMGLSYDFSEVEEMDFLRNTEVYDYLHDLLMRQGGAMGQSETVFSLGNEAAVPVALEWDGSRDRFLVGTVVDGLVLAVDEHGATEELMRAGDDNGLWSITGIRVDEANNRLWLATAAIPLFSNFDPDTFGQSALVEFKLDSLELIERYQAPADGMRHELGPIAQMPSGDIYVADRLAPLVFRKLVGSDSLERFTTLTEMAGLRDMTLGPGGHFLYLSDSENGILIIDPAQQIAARLEGPDTLNLWGIEGIFSTGNSLVVVQSGTSPQRVMKLTLDENFRKVTEIVPLAVAQDGFDWPTFGTIREDYAYFFANGQLLDPESSDTVQVMRTQLNPTEKIVAPDMQRFKEQQEAFELERAQQSQENE
jgi:hypothetical protein